MRKFHVPCNHERGVTVPDFHPLSLEEVCALLVAAPSCDSSRERSSIHIRLCQAIPGMTCPRPIDGPVAEKDDAMSALWVEWCESGFPDPPAMVRKIFEVIQRIAT